MDARQKLAHQAFALNTAAPKMTGGNYPRVDGPLKVTGAAKYTSDYHFPGMLYAVPVGSTIANGKLKGIDVSAAEKLPGVKAVFHRANIGPLFRTAPAAGFSAYMDERRPPFEDDVIRYYGQYIAVVVADTFEQARDASFAIKATYQEEKPDVRTHLDTNDKPKIGSERGNPEEAFAVAPVKIDQTYSTPVETHNPIELHASVAVWDGTSFTLYETSQAVSNHREVMAQMLGVPIENVRVISRFLGTGFGGKLWPWPHCLLAAASARNLNRPVKLVVSRQMMFQNVGHRPRTQQRVRLSATADGKLTSLQQDYLTHTSILDSYEEDCGEATPYLYSTPNLRITSGLSRRNTGTPTAMRGPGAVPGLFAIESGMDELAIKLKIDPVELRLRNEPKIDESLKLPFSSRHLTECLTTGAKKFGWEKRNPQIGAMKQDGLTLGWGVACCSWLAERFPAEATIDLRNDGTARISCGTQDIGTGTYTVLARVTSDKTGVPMDKVEVVLGDTSLPAGPISGGSMVTASVIPAIIEAATKATAVVIAAATKDPKSPFSGKNDTELSFTDGKVHLKNAAAETGVAFQDILKSSNISAASGTGKSAGTFGSPEPRKFSTHSFGAHFAEVTWQPEIARLRVKRVVAVIDGGHIVNQKPSSNQIEGAIVMGMGMAMFEQTTYDERYGAPINSNLADYIMATNADHPEIDVTFLDYPDKVLNEYGARGIGEIGHAGIAAALTSAVHHATGVRVRELPIRIEDLIQSRV